MIANLMIVFFLFGIAPIALHDADRGAKRAKWIQQSGIFIIALQLLLLIHIDWWSNNVDLLYLLTLGFKAMESEAEKESLVLVLFVLYLQFVFLTKGCNLRITKLQL